MQVVGQEEKVLVFPTTAAAEAELRAAAIVEDNGHLRGRREEDEVLGERVVAQIAEEARPVLEMADVLHVPHAPHAGEAARCRRVAARCGYLQRPHTGKNDAGVLRWRECWPRRQALRQRHILSLVPRRLARIFPLLVVCGRLRATDEQDEQQPNLHERAQQDRTPPQPSIAQTQQRRQSMDAPPFRKKYDEPRFFPHVLLHQPKRACSKRCSTTTHERSRLA
mmetsp:Transcript_92379/g.258141  ORF Transcript_92379/g.258141 Transcript_92379/m.258141 type:complete len:223 (+) Transcript_92379:1059-1727(+)